MALEGKDMAKIPILVLGLDPLDIAVSIIEEMEHPLLCEVVWHVLNDNLFEHILVL